MTTRLYWDFRGPQASGTAEHFRTHVDEFLARNSLTGCQTGVENLGKFHVAVWCDPSDDHLAAIERSLRPHRRESLPQ